MIQLASDAGNAAGLVFFLFDLLYLDGEDLTARSLMERKERLAHLLPSTGSPLHYSDHQIGLGPAFYDHACALGVEALSRNAPMPPMRPVIAGTARHSAYRSQFVVVTYPWHPLHGQRVRVYGRQRRAGRQILYIEVQPGLSREIPAWMCDAAVCATISSGPPRIAVAALTELRAVLDLCSTGRQSDRSLTPVMTKGGSNETSLDQSTRSRSRSRRHDHVVGTGARRTAAGARRAAPPSSRQANQGDPDPTGNM